MTVIILYIGGPLLDITITCDSEYLEKWQLKSDDCVRVQEYQNGLFQELFQNPSSFFCAGGSAQNSSRVSKWVLGNKSHVSFAGCVGKDEYATKLENELQKIGVVPLYCEHESLPTGICACLLSQEGHRSMCTNLAAAATYNMDDVNHPKVRQTLEESHVVFIAGYVLGHSPDVYKFVSEYCSKQGKIFATSLSAPYVCSTYSETLKECMTSIDIVFGNLDEAIILVNKLWPDSGVLKPEDCAMKLACLHKDGGDRIVVITDGANPLTVCRSGEEPKQWHIDKVDDVVDTIGCGDAFAGGFLATYAHTKSVDQAVRCGIICAVAIARLPGCTLPTGDFELSENDAKNQVIKLV